MKIIGSLVVCVGILTGCIDVDQEEQTVTSMVSAKKAETLNVEKQPPTAVKSETNQTNEGREAFSTLFQDTYNKNLTYLEKSEKDIQEAYGEPDESGWYEGGEFLQYDQFTYFIHPESNRAESVAVQDVSLKQADINERLGSADKRYENKMEGLWTEEYNYNDGKIVVEKASESSEEVMCIWFRK
ncbi:hypothetical protein J2S78_001369 [Salibacterium salarium]|uniref:hypothetical protein n=1 Tax=Salibacterium salarium TaxID=284579 RepID=UPI00277E6422|nr:hypothetical protein [Salibacterium salarium]MDQ0298949.1 hypothetical protein [Salibacterium salarium]